MRPYLPRLVLLGGFFLVALIGTVAFVALGKLALHLDPATHQSHLTSFIVATGSVAVAVASAFPIFARGVPWAIARLASVWPEAAAPQDALGASGSFGGS